MNANPLRNQELQDVVQQLWSDIYSVQDDITSSRRSLTTTKKLLDEKIVELNAATSLISEQQSLLAMHDDNLHHIEELRTALNDLANKQTQSQKIIANQEQEIIRLNEIEREVDTLLNEIESKNTTIASLQNSIKNYEKSLATLQTIEAELANAQSDLLAEKERNHDLHTEVLRKTADIEEHLLTLSQLQSNEQIHRQRILHLEAESQIHTDREEIYKKALDRIDELEFTCLEYEEALKINTSKAQEVEELIASSKILSSSLLQAQQDRDTALADARQQQEIANRQASAAKEFELQLDEMNKTLYDLQMQNRNAKNTIEDLEKVLGDSSSAEEYHKAREDQLNTTILESRKQNEDLKADKLASEKQIEDLTQHVALLRSSNDELESTVTSLQNTLHNQLNDSSEVLSSLDSTQKDLLDASAQISILQGHIGHLEQTVEELRKSSALESQLQVQTLLDDFAVMKKEQDLLELTLTQRQKQIEELENDIHILNTQLRQRDEKYNTLTSQITISGDEYQRRLKIIEQEKKESDQAGQQLRTRIIELEDELRRELERNIALKREMREPVIEISRSNEDSTSSSIQDVENIHEDLEQIKYTQESLKELLYTSSLGNNSNQLLSITTQMETMIGYIESKVSSLEHSQQVSGLLNQQEKDSLVEKIQGVITMLEGTLQNS